MFLSKGRPPPANEPGVFKTDEMVFVVQLHIVHDILFSFGFGVLPGCKAGEFPKAEI